jgi:hypothetical protein
MDSAWAELDPRQRDDLRRLSESLYEFHQDESASVASA